MTQHRHNATPDSTRMEKMGATLGTVEQTPSITDLHMELAAQKQTIKQQNDRLQKLERVLKGFVDAWMAPRVVDPKDSASDVDRTNDTLKGLFQQMHELQRASSQQRGAPTMQAPREELQHRVTCYEDVLTHQQGLQNRIILLESRVAQTEKQLGKLKDRDIDGEPFMQQPETEHTGVESQPQGTIDETYPDNMPEASRMSGDELEETSKKHHACDAETPGSHLDESIQNKVLDCGRNLHAWCIVHATTHLANPLSALSFMILSNGFVILQLFLLSSCILESSFSRCSLHGHCNRGEWCSPALGGEFTTDPGVCFDCWSARMFYNARFLNASYELHPDPYELMANAAGDKWLLDGSLHCNATDTYARRCDYLVQNLHNMTPLSMLIFTAMAGLIVATLVDECDQIEDCELLCWDRLIVSSREKHKYLIVALAWFACSLRRWVLPMMTAGACLGLVLRQPLSASNLLLNGLSIAFVTSLDDTLISLVYFPFQSTEDLPVYAVSVRTWIFHRLYAIAMFVAFLGTVLNVEGLLVEYGNEAKYGAVCSDLREIVTVYPFYVCFVSSFVHAVLRSYLRFISKSGRVPQKLSSKMSSLSLGMEQNNKVWDLAQFLSELLIPPCLVWYFRHAFVAQGALVMLQIGDGVKWFD